MKTLKILLLLTAVAAIDLPAQVRRQTPKETPAELLRQAREACAQYRFDKAIDLLDSYESALGKKSPAAGYNSLLTVAKRGRSMMERVEKIVIIDSIEVAKKDFQQAIVLNASSGRIESGQSIDIGPKAVDNSTSYLTEDGNTVYMVTDGSNGHNTMTAINRLADDTWEDSGFNFSDLGEGGDVNFPFLMSDGVTLYFANNGKNSIGGYDLFVSRRNGDTFLQPQNLGFPYNSTANDYLLAIDEEAGTGWLVTDRNNPGGETVTIYRFIPSEIRVNYPSNTPNLIDKALARNYKSTMDSSTDYTEKLRLPQNSDDASAPSFSFAMPGHKIYHSLNDFKSRTARSAMTHYLSAETEYRKACENLAQLRASYASGNKSDAGRIAMLEQSLPGMRAELARLRNEIVRAENPNL